MLRCMAGLTVDVRTEDGVADAYLAWPDAGVTRGGVLLLMDTFGLRDQIRAMADCICAGGYAVLAPNLFYRAGRAPVLTLPDLTDPPGRAKFFEQVKPLMGALTPERICADARAYVDYLAEEAPGPLAITGYCMGVRVGWRVATAYPDRVDALAGFHGGRLVTDDPDSPHRTADRLRAEVYLGHADNDATNTAEQIRALDQALEAAGVRYRSEVYAGAAHGFTMADTPAYNQQAAERHFRELFELLERLA